MAISRRLRFEILRRDSHQCRYCGATTPDAKLTVDHVLPTTLGGNDDPTNLVTACQDCNAGKSSIRPDDAIVAQVAEDALRWARAIALAAEQIRLTQEITNEQIDTVHRYWDQSWDASGQGHFGWPEADREAIRHWLTRGLTAEDMTGLVDVVLNKWATNSVNKWNGWRYFAGCCWRRIDEIEKTAREIVERTDAS